jgi:hypothetical protein
MRAASRRHYRKGAAFVQLGRYADRCFAVLTMFRDAPNAMELIRARRRR